MNATEYGTRNAVETALAAAKANPSQENRNNLNHHAQEFFRLNPPAMEACRKFIDASKASGQNIDIGIKAIEAALAAGGGGQVVRD